MYFVTCKETNYEWKQVTYNYTANQKDINVTWCFGIFHRRSSNKVTLLVLQVDLGII